MARYSSSPEVSRLAAEAANELSDNPFFEVCHVVYVAAAANAGPVLRAHFVWLTVDAG
jgi:hypothetical protein